MMADQNGGARSFPASREEVIAAYRLVLGREPESEEVIEAHRVRPRAALLRDFLASPEGRAANPEAASPEPRPGLNLAEFQLFPGFTEADLRIFAAFPVVPRDPQPGYIVDFLGNRTRTAFAREFASMDGLVSGHPVPCDFHADACEWLGLLKAVRGAGQRLRMAELGAGYGPWLVAAHAAARRWGIADIRLYGVEGNADHVASMRRNFLDNGIDPEAHHLIHAAIGTETGLAHWPVVTEAADHYGLRPVDPDSPDHLGRSFEAYVEVPVLGLSEFLGREERWTLLHIDVQGLEAALCASAIDLLASRVEWLVIGTHSRKLDGDLMDLFHRHRWVLEHERPAKQNWVPDAPTLEAMVMVDGTQVWRNPRLAAPFAG